MLCWVLVRAHGSASGIDFFGLCRKRELAPSAPNAGFKFRDRSYNLQICILGPGLGNPEVKTFSGHWTSDIAVKGHFEAEKVP